MKLIFKNDIKSTVKLYILSSLFFAFNLEAKYNDSLHFSRVLKNSKFMQTQLGYVSVYDKANKVGYSYSIGSELEFFVKNKLSFSSGLFYSNFYIKHNHQVQALDFSNSFKYYYKLRKRYTFNVHASVILDAKKEFYFVKDSTCYKYAANFSTGLGLNYMPYFIGKKSNRLGIFASIDLFYLYYNYVVPYSGFGIRYKL